MLLSISRIKDSGRLYVDSVSTCKVTMKTFVIIFFQPYLNDNYYLKLKKNDKLLFVIILFFCYFHWLLYQATRFTNFRPVSNRTMSWRAVPVRVKARDRWDRLVTVCPHIQLMSVSGPAVTGLFTPVSATCSRGLYSISPRGPSKGGSLGLHRNS